MLAAQSTTRPDIVANLNKAREDAIAQGRSPYSGNLVNYSTFAANQPSVITDTNIRDKRIPEMDQEATDALTRYDMNRQGLETKSQMDEDRAAEQDPLGSMLEDDEAIDPVSQRQLDIIERAMQSQDQATRNMANRQKAIFDRQRSQQQEAGTIAQGSAGVALGRLGGRYTPGAHGQVMSSLRQQTLSNLAEIDENESLALEQLRSAQETKDYELLNEQMGVLQEIRDERAEVLKAERTRVAAEQEKTTTAVNGILEDLAKNGAPANITAAVSSAGSVSEAIDAAGEWLMTATGDAGDYLFYKRDALNRGIEPMAADQYFAEKAREDMIGGLSEDQNRALNTLKGQMRLDPDVKDFIEVRNGFERVQTGADLNNAQGDLSLLFGYMKMLDPTSVVRETEFANAEAAMGYAQKVLNLPAKFLNGDRLTEEGRDDFAAAARRLYESRELQYEKAVDYYGQEADTYEIPRERLIRDFGTTVNDNEEAAKDRIIELGTNDLKIQETVTKFFKDYPEATWNDALQLYEEGPVSAAAGNRPQRNNNPLNIKASPNTLAYAGVVGKDPSPATDGGQFLIFETPQAGEEAAKRLLGTDGYRNLTVDAAMKRWSNNGYGGDVLPRLSNRKMSSLTPVELETLIRAMATREGYFA